MNALQTQLPLDKPRKMRRRPVTFALWSPALCASARRLGLHLHDARPRAAWESKAGFLERKTTVRGAVCAECGQRIPPGTLALHGHSGDSGRTPHPRYLHLEPCTGACPDCKARPCVCRLVRMSVRLDDREPKAAAVEGELAAALILLAEAEEHCPPGLQERIREWRAGGKLRV